MTTEKTASTLAIEIGGRLENYTFQPLTDGALVDTIKSEPQDGNETESNVASGLPEKDDFLEELLVNLDAAKGLVDTTTTSDTTVLNSSTSEWYFFRENNDDTVRELSNSEINRTTGNITDTITDGSIQNSGATSPGRFDKRYPLGNSGLVNQTNIPIADTHPIGKVQPGGKGSDIQKRPNDDGILDDVGEENLAVTDKMGVDCHLCGFVSPNKGELNKHLRKHSSEKPYACPVEGCNFRTRYPGNIKHHLPVHCEDRPFACDKCDLKFKTKNQLNTHFLVHSRTKPFVCDTCGFSCKRRWELRQHKLSHSDERYFRCDICGHATKTKSDLRKHEMKHRDHRDYKCNQCNKAYKDNRALQKHTRLSHTPQEPQNCHLCDKVFRNKVNLRNHLRLHNGHYPFVCDVCGMRFANNHNKRVHMAVHDGDRPYPCPLCPYAGKRDIDVRAHIGVMHREDKLFQCGPCNVGFSKERGLIQHFNTTKHRRRAEMWSNLCQVGKWLTSNPEIPACPEPPDAPPPEVDSLMLDEVKLEPLETTSDEDLPDIGYDNDFCGSPVLKRKSTAWSRGSTLPSGSSSRPGLDPVSSFLHSAPPGPVPSYSGSTKTAENLDYTTMDIRRNGQRTYVHDHKYAAIASFSWVFRQ